jgi:hypothetical protein
MNEHARRSALVIFSSGTCPAFHNDPPTSAEPLSRYDLVSGNGLLTGAIACPACERTPIVASPGERPAFSRIAPRISLHHCMSEHYQPMDSWKICPSACAKNLASSPSSLSAPAKKAFVSSITRLNPGIFARLSHHWLAWTTVKIKPGNFPAARFKLPNGCCRVSAKW